MDGNKSQLRQSPLAKGTHHFGETRCQEVSSYTSRLVGCWTSRSSSQASLVSTRCRSRPRSAVRICWRTSRPLCSRGAFVAFEVHDPLHASFRWLDEESSQHFGANFADAPQVHLSACCYCLFAPNSLASRELFDRMKQALGMLVHPAARRSEAMTSRVLTRGCFPCHGSRTGAAFCVGAIGFDLSF
ncbi:hypothetical protein ACVMAJ_001346 [Bradyrhizobium sp. USDA 4448]